MSADGRLEVVAKQAPVPSSEEVVVAVERCGICGSDVRMKASGMLPAGAVMGHEFAGTVVEVGDQVPVRLRPGLRVAVLPARRCGRCDACLAGRGHLCPEQAFTVLGLGTNDGAYAELVRVAARSCHPLPETMTPEQGALVEPYAAGLHAVTRSRAADETDPAVGIIGAGPLGLMCLAALRQRGAGALAVVAERSPRRSAAARAMGATVVADATRLADAAHGPLDVVFDAAGAEDTPGLALQVVRAGGQVVLLGAASPGHVLALPGLTWMMKEVEVAPSLGYTDEEFAMAVEAVAAGAVDPHLVVSDVRPLDAAEQSFEELGGPDPPVKVMLAPSR